jgi:RNA 3'-terminal phosphate cyclase (ATP)
MIELDGSYGEGGGQIVRTAVALSAVTEAHVKITNIRKGRLKPGLSYQHVKAIEALALITNAETSGVAVGSSDIIFKPHEIRGGSYSIDIGTAGSITLLMQCLLPAMVHAKDDVAIDVRGGTDVKWSPTIDYLRHVALPAFSRFGLQSSLDCSRRGYYPKGGGVATLEVHPGRLKHAHIEPEKTKQVCGISHCSNLPEHVAKRQAEAASEALKDVGFDSTIDLEVLKAPSTGSGISLWAGLKGGSALGERGLRAEVVGRNAAEELVRELDSDASVDVHLADQLIPYIALAGGSFSARELSNHARTNIWTAKHFLDIDISILENEIVKIEAAPK